MSKSELTNNTKTEAGLPDYSVSRLAGLIAGKHISPVELATLVLRRAEALQPTLNAFITLCHDTAIEEARMAEKAIMRGEKLGPLHGIPFSIKDNIPTAGIRTTFGSRIYADHVPVRDAVAVARAKAAGAIVIGKTTTPEFAFLGMTEAPLFGRTANPWNLRRTCGGSSGGAAAATAARLGYLALCTDAGGSARIPAACNGVVGFKPSLGTVPHDWAEDVFGNTQYVTPIARTVEDAALLLDVISGSHPSDPHTIGRPRLDSAAAIQERGDLSGLRMGWRALLGNDAVDLDVLEFLKKVTGIAESLGAHIVEARHPFENQESLITRLAASARKAQYGKLLEQHRDVMCPKLVRQFDQVGSLSAEDAWQGAFQRTRLFRQVQQWFEEFDVLLTPTLARSALPIDQDFFSPITINQHLTGTPRKAWYPYTIPFNATGHPALSIPCGLDREGMPVAVQLVGRIGSDAQLLRIGALLEQAIGFIGLPPLPLFNPKEGPT